MRIADPVIIFRRFGPEGLGIQEHGDNRGAWVQFIQNWGGGKPGDSWCCFLVCLVLYIVYAGKSPLKKTGNCAELLADATAKGYLLPAGVAPAPGDLFFYLDDNGHAHHVGLVTATFKPNPMSPYGIAGNTSPDGTSSNGSGVFEHRIAGRMAFVRLPA